MKQSIALKGLEKVKILKKFEKNFKDIAKISINYFDVKNNPVFPANQPFSLFDILSQEDKKNMFLNHIETAFQSTINSRTPYVFTCSALLETAVPIIVNNEVIGLALTTPVRDKNNSQMPDDLKQLKNTDTAKLIKEWDKLPVISKNIFESWAKMLFDMLNYIFKREYDFLVFSETENQITRSQEVLNKALLYIKENYHQRSISLGSTASEVCLSHFYFSHLFKRELKMTFIDYLTKVRLEAAVKLLKNLRLNVNQIAYAVGYQDSNYFSKVFKRSYGFAPLEYRQRVFKKS